MVEFFSLIRFITVMVSLTFMVKYICMAVTAKYKANMLKDEDEEFSGHRRVLPSFSPESLKREKF